MDVANTARTPVPESHRTTLRQMASHARTGVAHAGRVAEAERPWERFEWGIRAADAFEHAVDDARSIPGAGRFVDEFMGKYRVARRAAEAALATGAVPAAAERFGRAELLEGRNHFHSARAAVARATAHVGSEASRSEWLSARDWLGHSIDDAVSGSLVTRQPRTGAELVALLTAAHTAARVERSLSERLLDRIDGLYGDSLGALDALIGAADAAAAPAAAS